MGLGDCDKCIKYLLFAFNLIFWILGCAIVAIGLFVRFSPEARQMFEGGEFHLLSGVQHTGAYVLIGVGAVMMVVGFLGCCGAIRENVFLLGAFFACLLILFLILIGCAIWAFIILQVQEKEAKSELTETLLNKVRSYGQEPEFMDNLQRALACCGAHNSSDYGAVGASVPESCGDPVIDTIQYSTGCSQKIFTTFRESVLFIGFAGLIVAICLVFGMIFSMCLCQSIRKGGTVA